MLKKCLQMMICLLLGAGVLLSAHASATEDFFTAIESDDGASITQILDQGFDPNTPNSEGQVALFVALQKESYRAVAALMKSKQIQINASNAAGETPLMMAALKGSLEWTHKLLLRGAEVNRTGWTALHYAACSGQPNVVSLLLDNGALINAESPNRTTPLMMAARYGDESTVKLLADRQADGRKTNEQGLDAMHFAQLGGRDFLVKILQDRYARP